MTAIMVKLVRASVVRWTHLVEFVALLHGEVAFLLVPGVQAALQGAPHALQRCRSDHPLRRACTATAFTFSNNAFAVQSHLLESWCCSMNVLGCNKRLKCWCCIAGIAVLSAHA